MFISVTPHKIMEVQHTPIVPTLNSSFNIFLIYKTQHDIVQIQQEDFLTVLTIIIIQIK